MAEPSAAAPNCDHFFETRIRGGHALSVRVCILCRLPDWADLQEQLDALYGGNEAALTRALGGDRTASVVAHTLNTHGHAISRVRYMTDEQLLAVPGIGETSLATIRVAFPAPESAPAPDRLDSLSGPAAVGALRLIFTRWKNAGHVPSSSEELLELLESVQALAAPRLLDCGFCYEEQGEEVHPHPECPIGAPGGVASPLRDRLRAAIDPILDEHPEHNRIDAHERVLDEITDAALGVANQAAGEALAEARMWARHGYEIGQRHCSWSDHGVAPAWLTEGWPPHFDSCEHLKRACEYDETITRVRAEAARIRSITPTWGPVADLIEAAIDDPGRPKEQRARPVHPDGSPYSYAEIVAEGWRHCDGCGMWSTATAERPHQCAAPAMANETATDSEEATDV
ncbi:hypothetical protein ACKI14_02795 [Streptomyces turgidiscabies]|uniref:hypothetical protein n=1 Tax=Streptomyces turgidiscabies TaxID=85558 RepID=UPI0038F6685C